MLRTQRFVVVSAGLSLISERIPPFTTGVNQVTRDVDNCKINIKITSDDSSSLPASIMKSNIDTDIDRTDHQ
jgi:hypothetical protein